MVNIDDSKGTVTSNSRTHNNSNNVDAKFSVDPKYVDPAKT
jgi:hypothetical protein